MCSAPQTQRCSLLPGASTAEAAVGRRRRLQGNLLTALPIPSQRRRSCFLPPPFSLLPIQSQPIRNKTEVSNRCKSSFISIHQQQSRDQQQLKANRGDHDQGLDEIEIEGFCSSAGLQPQSGPGGAAAVARG
ncbi:hypothetical protein DAI22_01g321100 [Oryza sativa Japonica Group]|nr:hypothetical protein DAI22_01g321100 [Oryza sativa Japonica Group]